MVSSNSREMYLKTIYELEAGDDPVAVSLVAERLDVSPVSATEMIKRLTESKMVVHTPYKGVTLTKAGYVRAANVVRRQRLWCRFLSDHLQMPWELVYDQACRLEHAADSMVTEALAVFLNNPKTCAHGNPIPNPDGTVETMQDIPLNEAIIGQNGQITRVELPETKLCSYLAQKGVLPGVSITVEDEAPFDGPLTIRIGEREIAIGREVARRVFFIPKDSNA